MGVFASLFAAWDDDALAAGEGVAAALGAVELEAGAPPFVSKGELAVPLPSPLTELGVSGVA